MASAQAILGLFLVAMLVVLGKSENATNVGSVRGFAVAPPTALKETKALILSSNLPAVDQNNIASRVQSIYNTIFDPLTRSVQIQNYLQGYFPTRLNNVVLGYSAVAYFQNYYLTLLVNGEYALIFGIQC